VRQRFRDWWPDYEQAAKSAYLKKEGGSFGHFHDGLMAAEPISSNQASILRQIGIGEK
jgi:hypothetical protein